MTPTPQNSQPLLANKYRLLKPLGQGGMGITYIAKDVENDQLVAIKTLSLHRVKDWKVLELFEREARILSQLDHSAIPRYIDYFQLDQPDNRNFYLVQQLAPGESLATLVKKNGKLSIKSVKKVATKILEILVYLQNFNPPIIHRDIKPQNIIFNQDKTASEQLFLVDFGAVQETYQQTVAGGSTIVGTYGYIAPEQFRGQAKLGTDLYGLGTTLLFLLWGDSPATLPQDKLKINFREVLNLDQFFADWLDKMIEPALEDRFSSAQEALAVLRGEQVIPPSQPSRKMHRKPANSEIKVKQAGEKLLIKIPSGQLRSSHSQKIAIFIFLWDGILAFLMWCMIDLGLVLNPANYVIFGIFTLFGLWILYKFIYAAFSVINIEVSPHQIQISKTLLNSEYQNKILQDIQKICSTQAQFFGINLPFTMCELITSRQTYRFASLLPRSEQNWLVQQLQTCLSFGQHSAISRDS
ncbi:serine/threonine-protein kinase [Spirulina sp. CS-785/01]|uniref:serine/threonine protein kinase n=1 Tax=Spirulina sp. CS-785/01 TaxID=3021716 RepID=UPI00232C40B2|nr:serine/threonine-protein kinase [Spirulina sp. CS-785/01]MDB9312150.1 serine/threonine-protein kinase [Spirulina sp. CS-785/01]